MYSKIEFFHALLQNSLDIITLVSSDGTILYESPSVDRILGYDQRELIGKNVFEMIHPEDLQKVRTAFREVVSNRDLTLSADFRFLHKDGSWRVLYATGSNHLDNPLIDGIVVNSRDITERNQVEEKLRQSEERFRRIFEDGPLGMIVIDPSYRFLKANKSFCEMLGYTEQELVGRSIEDLTHPEEKEESLELSQRVLRGETPLFHLEKRYVKKDQESLWVKLTATAIHDPEGKVLYALGMIEDISERKVADREREQLISQLTEALTKIKTLTGLIPICAWCKKIRDDKGYWIRVETYIKEHSNATFTHCVCPTCLKKEDPATFRDIFGQGEKAQVSKSNRENRNSERLRLRKPVNCAFKMDSGESGKVVINAILEEIGDAGICVRTDHLLEDDTLLFSSSSVEDKVGVVRWRKPAAPEEGGYRVGIQFVRD
ncbi:MAG TPA: PAS domain S-box protein [Nitrospirota bacterium]|nr:PAS domain S-box protein [Nitrospirota bacterium]